MRSCRSPWGISPGPCQPLAGCPPPASPSPFTAPARTAQVTLNQPPAADRRRLSSLVRVEELHYDLERDAVRVVLTDRAGRVLLFHVLTPDQAPDGWWELPGGGISPGESYLDAAVREIREETGLVLDPGQVGPPLWRRDSTWRSRGMRRLQHEVVVL